MKEVREVNSFLGFLKKMMLETIRRLACVAGSHLVGGTEHDSANPPIDAISRCHYS